MKKLGILAAVVAMALAGPANAQSPILEYLFEEGTGANTANSGTVVSVGAGTLEDNATFSSDTPNGSSFSLLLDGTDDRVVTSNAFDYTVDGTTGGTPHNQLTVEAWINPAALPNNQNVIWDHFGAPGVLLLVTNTGAVQWSISTGTNTAGTSLVAGNVTTDGSWQHVAGIYDGTEMRIFVNGQDTCASVANTGNITRNSSNGPFIGASETVGALGFDGKIDDVRVFPVALDRTQLAGGFFDDVDEILCVVQVDIDIKPGSFPNSINLGSGGVIPVAILGSADLDVNDIDVNTLVLGTAGIKTVGKTDRFLCSVEDVSGDFTFPEGAPDGFLDLVCHFVTVGIVPEAGETSAKLSGDFISGDSFDATDSVNIVP